LILNNVSHGMTRIGCWWRRDKLWARMWSIWCNVVFKKRRQTASLIYSFRKLSMISMKIDHFFHFKNLA